MLLISRPRIVGFARLAAPITSSIIPIVLENPISHHPRYIVESTYLPPQSLKPLLLRLGIDPGANDKANNVEEGHPSLFG